MSQKRDHDTHDGKRGKAPETEASRVLHVRGLPQYTTEQEVRALAEQFGTVQKVLILGAKQQAFVQMDTIEAATKLLARYTSVQAVIRGKPVYFQYSSRSEVKTPTVQAVTAPAVLGAYPAPASSSSSTVSTAYESDSGSAPNNILIVSILNPRVPVTIENIYQVFKPYGDVQKIITFVKGQELKALVQLATVDSATAARHNLEGKDMFLGCCHLRIGFSKLKDLSVKSNNARQRDFTVPDFPTADYAGYGKAGFAGAATTPPYIFGQGGLGPFGAAGYGGQYGVALGQQSVLGAVNQTFLGDQKGAVLLVSNLNPEKMNVDKLFMLFGVYGDVMRVKILYNKRDTALVQFANSQQAQTAQAHLNRLFLHDKELNVNLSKKPEISLPRTGDESEAAALTKDFTDSPIHRFKHRANRNLKNINAPSQVLHVSNLFDGCTEDELRKLFAADQAGPPAVQFFKNDRKMAYVRMDSVPEAVNALMRLHNHKLGDRFMRVSFSHKEPAKVTDSDSAGADVAADESAD